MQNNIAGVGRRVLEGLIDLLVLLVIIAFFGALFGDVDLLVRSTTIDMGRDGDIKGNFGYSIMKISGWSALVIGNIVMCILYTGLEYIYGRTPGKFICRTKVVCEEGYASISLRQAIVRNILRFIDYLFFGLVGFIIVVLSEKNQRIGDFVAKTVVIKG